MDVNDPGNETSQKYLHSRRRDSMAATSSAGHGWYYTAWVHSDKSVGAGLGWAGGQARGGVSSDQAFIDEMLVRHDG